MQVMLAVREIVHHYCKYKELHYLFWFQIPDTHKHCSNNRICKSYILSLLMESLFDLFQLNFCMII